MKKIIIFTTALAAMTACNKSVLETATPSEGFGYINLGISADAEMVVTKAERTPSAAELADYTVTLKQGETTKWTKKYKDIGATDWKVAAGTYTVEVENLTVTEAYANPADNSNHYGKLRLAGSSLPVTVNAGQETSCPVKCTAANSKVTFTTDTNFGNVFTISATSLKVTMGNRTVSYTSLGTDHDTATPAFFEAGDVTWTLRTKVGETTKEYTKTLKLVAGQWSKVTFSSSNGKITLTITVNDEMTTVDVSESIDPSEQQTNTPA